MSFSFSVRIIKENTFLPVPSVENDKYWMIFGIEDNLDKAMKAATKRMAEWLKKEYTLNDAEVSQVIGPAIEYRIAKVAASKVEVVAILPKNIISTLMAIRRTGAPN